MKKTLLAILSIFLFFWISFWLSPQEQFIDSYITNALSSYDANTQATILSKAASTLESLLSMMPAKEAKKPILQLILNVVKHKLDDSNIIKEFSPPVTSTSTLDTMQQTLLDWINATRRANWLTPLIIHQTLQSLAQSHVDEMAAHNYFDHTNLAGDNSVARIQKSDYRFWYAGETLAYNSHTVDVVVNGRLNSPAHKAIMLSDEATQVWIWYTTKDHMWVVVYAAPL